MSLRALSHPAKHSIDEPETVPPLFLPSLLAPPLVWIVSSAGPANASRTRSLRPLPLLTRFAELGAHDLECGLVQTRRTPTHLFLEMAFNSPIEQRKHYTQHARIRVQTANGDLANLPRV